MTEQEFLKIKSKAEAALEKDEHEKALNLLEQMYSMSPDYFADRSDLYLRMGDFHLKNDNQDKAGVCYQEAYNISPNDPMIGISLLSFLVKSDQLDRCENLVSELENLELSMHLSLAFASYCHRVGNSELMWKRLEAAVVEGAMDIDLLEYQTMDDDISSDPLYSDLFD